MALYEEEQTKLLRLHEVLEEIPSDPESEDDEEDATATHDILGTYVLDVNNYLVPCTNDDNNVGLTTYDNLNSDQDIEFENSMNIDKMMILQLRLLLKPTAIPCLNINEEAQSSTIESVASTSTQNDNDVTITNINHNYNASSIDVTTENNIHDTSKQCLQQPHVPVKRSLPNSRTIIAKVIKEAEPFLSRAAHTLFATELHAAVTNKFNRKVRRNSRKQYKRMLKSQGSCKLENACTSVIKVVLENNGHLCIKWQKTHGHECELQHIRLAKEDRQMIASKFMSGVPAKRILESTHNKIEKQFKRIDILTSEDITNVKTAFNPFHSSKYDEYLKKKRFEEEKLLKTKQAEKDLENQRIAEKNKQIEHKKKLGDLKEDLKATKKVEENKRQASNKLIDEANQKFKKTLRNNNLQQAKIADGVKAMRFRFEELHKKKTIVLQKK
ncbi:hypothetical protein FQA39_LY12175 [Lamprigera yunnana]|nr:hypothetical protein FQA39_LY12175 [Lamprigera yunnana]